MDDDEDYQRMADYENEIYDLNHGVNQDSDDESSDDPVKVAPEEDEDEEDEDEDVSDRSSPQSSKKISTSNGSIAQTVHFNDNILEVEGQVDDDSSNLSDDERDLIYSRLYHSGSSVPKPTTNYLVKIEATNKSGPREKNSSNNAYEQHRVPSTNFTIELDLDNLPPPPESTNQATDSASVDEDDDYPLANRGRYFGPPAPPAPQIICFRCNQPGHIKAQCKHQICHHCNALDSHPTYQCPSQHFCSNCSQSGHSKTQCPIIHNEDPSKPCAMCGDFGHVAAACHQIWRYYRPVEPDKMEMCRDIKRYCYNCAVLGHLGDDCPRPRPFYVQRVKKGIVVSAFGEGNVPEWAKKSEQNNAKRKNKSEIILEDDDDGWFAGQPREPPKAPRRIGGIKLNNNTMQREAMANAAEARRNKDRRLNELPPPRRRPSSRDRSPEHRGRSGSSSVDSYRPNYPADRLPRDNDRDGRDWESKVGQWRRNREVDRWTPTGNHLR